jgi:hypothetical protein
MIAEIVLWNPSKCWSITIITLIETGYLCEIVIGGNMRKVAHAINQPTINIYEINLHQLQTIG